MWEKEEMLISMMFTEGFLYRVLKVLTVCLTLYHTMTNFDAPEKKPFENIVGKGENAGNQHFSTFPTIFSIL